MTTRFNRMMLVLERIQRTGARDAVSLAAELGMTEGTVRRYVRELESAGALRQASPPVEPSPSPRAVAVANDGAAPHPVVLTEDELAALHVGARFLMAEGDPAMADAARRLLSKLARVASPQVDERLSDLQAVYDFPPAEREAEVRRLVNQAITERRVLALQYCRESDTEYVTREVEPLAQFFTDDHWSFLAYCRLRRDLRTFRHERTRGVKLLDQYFEPRQGMSLEQFIQRRKAQLRSRSRAV